MTRRKLKYKPTVHAIERFREYFGTKEIHAVDFANEFMRKSQYVVTQSDGRKIYKNEDYDAMIVVADDNAIVTVLPPAGKGERNKSVTAVKEVLPEEPEVKPADIKNNEFLASFQATVKRELAKAQRQFTREYRKLTEEIAIVGIDIAQLALNRARARSPITQKQITEKISEIHAEQTKLAEQRKQLEAQFKAMKSEVSGFVAE